MRDYDGGRTVSLAICSIDSETDFISWLQASDFEKFLSNPDVEPEKPEPVDFGTYDGSEHVIRLNSDNFENVINKADRILIMFYAPC